MRTTKLAAVVATLLWLPATGIAKPAQPSTVNQWNQALLEAISTTGTGPTVASRALAIAHTCMFDAWAAYDQTARGTQFGSHLRRPRAEHTLDNKRAAVSHAAYRAALDLFPSEKPRFDALLRKSGQRPDLSNGDVTKPAGIANVACGEVLEVRHRDGSNQLGDRGGAPYSDYTGYQPVNSETHVFDPSRWQPLRVPTYDGRSTYVQKFLTPQWGWVQPFALRPYRSYGLQAPPRYGSAEYEAEAREIVEISARLTEKQKVIAEYWANGPHSVTPPGHWNMFAQVVSKRVRRGIDGDVKLFFALNNALMDAGIFAWRSKVELDYVRPITAIRTLYAGKTIRAWAGFGRGTQEIAGHTWSPYQPAYAISPPFAECVSGHSTFSAAAAQVLRTYTGSDRFEYSAVVPAGSSLVEPGLVPARDVKLHWATFSEAADEAGFSRRYGGIHFSIGDLEGRRVGRVIGKQAWQKARSHFGGRQGG
ncbi:vanadium-dependent haloperoxidase [Lysobacter korlensis]|uniref:Vanadium-dependent haloperoxidase n=1 Tax=Lysobacter korlensis TaxID=553636 RepID=A0ABV6RJQ0_9GAMM